MLITKGKANIDAVDGNDRTPLAALCKTFTPGMLHSTVRTANLLLRNFADETKTDEDGNKPADLINERWDPDSVLKQVVENAPTDKRWYRRGWIVMLRSRADANFAAAGDTGGGSCNAPMSMRAQMRMMLAAEKAEKASKARRIDRAETEGDFEAVVTSLVGLNEEGLFRRVVRFV